MFEKLKLIEDKLKFVKSVLTIGGRICSAICIQMSSLNKVTSITVGSLYLKSSAQNLTSSDSKFQTPINKTNGVRRLFQDIQDVSCPAILVIPQSSSIFTNSSSDPSDFLAPQSLLDYNFSYVGPNDREQSEQMTNDQSLGTSDCLKYTVELTPQYFNSTFSSIIYNWANAGIPLSWFAISRIRPGPIRGAPFPIMDSISPSLTSCWDFDSPNKKKEGEVKIC